MKKILLAAFLCLLAASTVLGQADVQMGPYRLKLQAYVSDTAPAGTKPSYVWKVVRDAKTYTLQIVKHESLSTTVSMMDIDAQLAPVFRTLGLAGDDKSIKALTSAKPDQLLDIAAYIRTSGTPELNLDTVAPAKK